MRLRSATLAAGLLMLSACSPALVEGEDVSYSPPAWMADVVAQDEEYMSAMTTCLEDRGQTVVAHGGKVGIETLSDEDGQTLPGVSELADEAWGECSALVPEQAYISDDRDLEYDRMLDTVECLAQEGHPLSAPPSREAWVSGSVEYSPYAELTGDDEGGAWAVETDEVLRLLEVCPASSQKLVVLDSSGAG